MEEKLNSTTKQVIKDLQSDLGQLLLKGSNIEVMWSLQKMHHDNALLKSADLIEKSIK